MDKHEFKKFRTKLSKTQKQMDQLLGTSLKAVHSYEQGWRSVPPAVERQVYFLISKLNSKNKGRKYCWDIKKCSPENRNQCPAWEFQSGDLCWFINGTICEGGVQSKWQDKMKICRSCKVLTDIL